MKTILAFGATLILAAGAGRAEASVLVGPIPYLSSADIPAGFYAGGSPTALEDFEDATLDFGIIASNGFVLAPGAFGNAVDSVDGDDGSIDGSGLRGHSWFYTPGSQGVIFTFPAPVTAAGIVWTDGAGLTTFEAFGPGMVSLGTIGPVAIADGSVFGETAEDRFFGVQDLGGIIAVKLSNTLGGIEVDHVQFGAASIASIPEPSMAAIWVFLGIAGFVVNVSRRRRVRG